MANNNSKENGKKVLKGVLKGTCLAVVAGGMGIIALERKMVKEFYKFIDLNGGH